MALACLKFQPQHHSLGWVLIPLYCVYASSENVAYEDGSGVSSQRPP